MVREIMDYISSCDEAVGKALYAEYHRQQRNLELIASENIVSPAVMLAMGTVPTNKYAEGIRRNDIMVAARKLTYWKIWQLSGQRSCLVQNMHVCSHIPVQAQILLYIRRFWSREIR